MTLRHSVLAAALLLVPNCLQASDNRPDINSALKAGQLGQLQQQLSEWCQSHPDDREARFGLGTVQFLQAVEGLGQDQFRYGLLAGRARMMPFMRLPIPENPEAEEISWQKARALVQRFVDRLNNAEKTLAAVPEGDFALEIQLGEIRLDLNGDGNVVDEESVWFISQTLQNPRQPDRALPVKKFTVVFDAADVFWLRGYCHALSALGEIVLAYDWKDQFERTAHLFYPRVKTPYPWLLEEGTGQFMGFGAQNLLDLIAWLHTINYEVAEPKRLRAALEHMETVIRMSRRSWQLIEAETDDNHEWVPGPHQTSIMQGFSVGQEVVAGWRDFLDEIELILQGKKLVPFWRGVPGGLSPFNPRAGIHPRLGINVRRIFTEPSRLDFALWLQGTGLQPYLEEGDITSPERWQKMMAVFQGRFFNFLFWFN